MFWFPHALNGVTVRFRGLFVVTLCVLGIIFWDNTTMHWAIGGLAADFIIVFFAGGRFSILGSLAEIPSWFFAPDLIAGPPKQFAAFVGVIFSGAAALAFLFGQEAEDVGDEDGYYITGAIILAMLLGPAAMECFLDICLGCKFFAIFVWLHIIPKSVLDLSEDSLEDAEEMLADEANLFDWFTSRPRGKKGHKMCELFKPVSFVRKLLCGGGDFEIDDAELEAGKEMAEVKDSSKEKKKKKKEKAEGENGEEEEDSDEDTKKVNTVKKYRRPLFNGKFQRMLYVPVFQDENCHLLYEELNEVATAKKYTHRKKKSKKRIDDGPLPLKYKLRFEDENKKLGNYHPIKNIRIDFFAIPLGIVGLAMAWRSAEDTFDIADSRAYWISLAIGAAAVFFAVCLLYLWKVIFYPRKIVKEWDHPVLGNFFAAPWIILLGLAFLTDDDSEATADVLFWIGGPVGIVFGYYTVARWFTRVLYIEHLSPLWLFAPLTSLVAAIVAPVVYTEEIEVAYFFFGFGVITWLPLFVITFYRVAFKPPMEEKLLVSLWIWVAAVSVIALSYLSIGKLRCAVIDSATPEFQLCIWDSFASTLFWASAGLFAVLGALFLMRYFSPNRFEVGYWGYAFPLSVFAMLLNAYHVRIDTDLTNAAATLGMILASYVVAMLVIHTVLALLKKQLFIPVDKWSPLSMNLLIHDAFRMSLAEVQRNANRLKPDNDESIAKFVSSFRLLHMMHHEHASHEDDYIYPLFATWFPGIDQQAAGEHEHGEELFSELAEAADALQGKSESEEAMDKDDAITKIQAKLPEAVQDFLQHLDYEELHLNPVGKKYLPLKLHKELVRKMWEHTSGEKWAVLVPWVLNHQTLFGKRVRFLKALVWAMPERAQLIGVIVRNGVTHTMWEKLTRFVPQIVPRHGDVVTYHSFTRYVRYF